MTIADCLKLARVRAGYRSARQAARLNGWNVSTYKGYENGSRRINPEAAARYAEAFGTTPEWILYRRESEKSEEADLGLLEIAITLALRYRITAEPGAIAHTVMVFYRLLRERQVQGHAINDPKDGQAILDQLSAGDE